MDLDTLSKAREERLKFLGDNVRHPPKLGLSDQSATNARDLLSSGHFSDFTIRCDAVSFPVHKSILWMQSGYFKVITGGPFEESNTNEVTLKDTQPLTVAVLLLMIYSGDDGQNLDRAYEVWPALKLPVYEGTSEEHKNTYLSTHFYDELKTLINVYVLADRLLVSHIANAVARYLLGQMEGVLFADFKRKIFGPGLQALPDILEHIYKVTQAEDVKLREETTMLCLRNQHILKKASGAVEVIEQHDGRAWRMGKRSAKLIHEVHGKLLSRCAGSFTGGIYVTTAEFERTTGKELWTPWGI
ncbi:uncharacterized protein AB675_8507 [Cyphellophora attinorum]|uniref:BTB domain-containing protein n=1 Tax=Cyphellophora attinorum TaxID=1664694 RepID=A0A0N1P3Q0_9EURO|nr:uncharacterized protein AB675_8507 [Phialophora attinorum]KPI44312.1 hypothetical protein AB675_8507 [Phialophora attinorum]